MIDLCLTNLFAARPLKRLAPMLSTIIVCLAMFASADANGERVIVVRSSDAAPYQAAEESLKKELRSLGVKSSAVTLASLEKNATRSSFGDDRVDAYIAVGTPATVWLYNRLENNIPLVSCMISDRLKSKLDGHRGLTALSMQLSLERQFELLQEAVPDANTIGMLYSSKSKSSILIFEEAQSTAPAGASIVAVDVDQHSSRSSAIKTLFDLHPDVVWTDADASVYNVATVKAMLLGALEKKTPVFGFSLGFVRSGALLGISVDPAAQGAAAARMTRAMFDRQSEPGATNPTAITITKTDQSIIAVNLIVADRINAILTNAFIAQASKVFR